MNQGCTTRHLSFVMSCSFTNQVIVQLELWNECKNRKREVRGQGVRASKAPRPEVAALHLEKLGAGLS
jgi:adenosylhomocysteinase